MFAFLKQRPIQIVSILLALQGFALLSLSRKESVPPIPRFATFPDEFGNWTLIQEQSLDKETQAILKPDDYLLRIYHQTGTGLSASLFVAYFQSQRTDKAPHSPRNCLPGSGWVPTSHTQIEIPVPHQSPLRINRYIVAKQEDKATVFYWYQTWNRVVASEYMARFYLIADSVRYNRTDTALVRVMFPGDPSDYSKDEFATFIASFYPALQRYFRPPPVL